MVESAKRAAPPIAEYAVAPTDLGIMDKDHVVAGNGQNESRPVDLTFRYPGGKLGNGRPLLADL